MLTVENNVTITRQMPFASQPFRSMHRTIAGRAIAAVFGMWAALVPFGAGAAALPDGTLARAEGESRLYVIDDGARRWIDAPATLRAHGLTAAVTVIPGAELAQYPEGAPLTAGSRFIIAGEEAVLPDLVPLAAEDLRFGTAGGRTVLRFASKFWNMGKGMFELLAHPKPGAPVNSDEDSFQHIVRPGGASRQRLVGHFTWHAVHYHYHYSDFVDYVLELVKPADGASAAAPVATRKTSFCMRDNGAIDTSLPGAPRSPVYNICGKVRQGVSVGWADIYGSELPDQFIDVHDLPAGLYKLSFHVDPRARFLELRQDNNSSAAFIELDPRNRTVKVVASGAPFATWRNQFPDGMLVRGERLPAVYVMKNNKKRALTSAAVFESYGYAWNDVRWLPQGVIEAIPSIRVIREPGTTRLHMLNAAGYRRLLLNPEVYSSYGFMGADVADVNAVEFATFRETDMIRREDSDVIFSLATKQALGTISELQARGVDLAPVHTLNETDFAAYMIQVVATGLDVPWEIAFLPDGDMLVTERPGTLRRIGRNPAMMDVPAVRGAGEGGLMGIALHPSFAQNRLVYLYYTSDAAGLKNRVTRFRIDGDTLVEDKVIIDDIPSAIYHDGGRIAFGPDGMLYITTGDASTPALAQDLSSLAGKTLRLTPDGQAPPDNPFGTPVWSYGHRNSQGIAWDAQGRMWQTEHGRSGAVSGYDELNLVEKGKNYGWPTIEGNAMAAGMTGPVRHSGTDVTWAPAGAAFIDGSLYFAGLRGSTLYQAKIGANGAVTEFKGHFAGKYGRLRAVVRGPDGALYISTSNRDGRGTVRSGDDKILRVHPAALR